MSQSSSISPFALHGEIECPWITWEKKTAITSLSETKETDGRYEEHADASDCTYSDTPVVPIKPAIQRQQYNAILNRMNQAVCKTGSFAAWNQ